MKVLLIGGGGREHALAWRILQSPLVEGLLVTHANPGFPDNVVTVVGDLIEAARSNQVGLVVIGPEAPLAAGVSDELRAAGFSVFGPSQKAAQLEASKTFAKAFMDRHQIPTAGWSVHDDAESAHAAIVGPCVVKADGLAAGKGVLVVDSAEEAHAAVDRIFGGAFGEAGHRVVIEERLVGPEVSVLALCDGIRAIPMLPCRDHKRRFDGGLGPNTGGMGAVCPPADVDTALVEEVCRTVLMPTVRGMAEEGAPFKGVLYAGLMLTADGPKVLEFNARFGDPECQPLMMMLDEDIVPLMLAAAEGALPDRSIHWKEGGACCVVMVAGDYPGTVQKGMVIESVPDDSPELVVFYAGAAQDGPVVRTSGGRVLGVTAWGENLDAARESAYKQVESIHFETAAWRSDIGLMGAE